MSKKKKRKPSIQKKWAQKTLTYVCADYGAKEGIPVDVLEYFDEINPEQLLYGSHQFRCEKCSNGIMEPMDELEIIIRGYGLHEGIEERLK